MHDYNFSESTIENYVNILLSCDGKYENVIVNGIDYYNFSPNQALKWIKENNYLLPEGNDASGQERTVKTTFGNIRFSRITPICKKHPRPTG